MDIEYRASGLSPALVGGAETDLLLNGAGAAGLSLLPSAATGIDAPGADVITIALSNAGNTVETIAVYLDGVQLSTTTSLAATTGKRHIMLRGVSGVLRVTGTSAAGVAGGVTVTVTASRSGASPAYQYIIDGVVQGASSGGTVVGNLSSTGGTITLSATGAAVLDASTSVTVGGTNATSLVLGRAAVVPSLPGGVSVGASKAITGSGALALEATGALTIAGAASTTSSLIGRAGNLTTLVGGAKLAQNIVINRVATAIDATAAGTVAYYGVTDTSGARAIGVPSAVTAGSGAIIIVKDESGGANTHNITITPTAGNIDGAATKVISAAYGVVRLISDGANWFTW